MNCETELGQKMVKRIYKILNINNTWNSGNLNATPPGRAVSSGHSIGAIFQMNHAKLYVLVVTLSINDNIKFLENIKQWFKGTTSRNKYRFEIRTQPKDNNLDHLIDPAFINVNRMFVILFKNDNGDPTWNSIDRYYMPLVEIKYFNPLIDNKPFFYQPVKKDKKPMKNLLKCQEIMTIQQEKLFDFLYYQNYYKLGMDFSRQTNRVFLKKLILKEN